jgi:hypothetical protein
MATGTLRYLDAMRVTGPAGELGDLQVSDSSGSSLGRLAGFVVDPAARQLRYFVVEVRRWLSRQRYLVPLCPATLEAERQTMRLDCDPASTRDWRKFDDRLFSCFSDNDLLDVLFGEARQSDAHAETAS